MHLSRLSLTDFRNHAAFDIAPGPGLVALYGHNGAGKTNVLEAISLLAPGRGLRRAAFADMAREGGAGGFAVAAELTDAAATLDPVRVGTGLAATAPGRRQVRVNGAPATASGLGEWLSVLWLTPAMDRLFVDAAGARRRFLDRLVLALEPAHAAQVTRYDAAMRARTRLLAEERRDLVWLTALEGQMAEHGAAMAAARARTVDALRGGLAAAPGGPFARPDVALVMPDGAGDAACDADRLASALAAARGRDAAAGRALVGPHRVDLAVRHADRDRPAALCSTGEQKALLLALILAHADLVARLRGARPVLLLDEVAAHLDPLRRAALFDRLHAAGGQAWLTGTEAALFADLPPGADRFLIGDGAPVAWSDSPA